MSRREPSGRRTRALSAAAAVSLVAVPVLALSACGASGSQALESLASKASSAIASATSDLPSRTTDAPTTSEPAPTTSRATSFSPLTTSATTTSTPTTSDPTTTTQTPTKTETTTATQTQTATTTTTVTPTPTPTPTSSSARPTSASPSPSGSGAPAPASSGTPWLPWVLGLVVLLILGLVWWLVARARKQRAWRDQLRATTGSFDQLTSTFLPRLVANPADPSLPGTWSVVRPQVAEAVRGVDALAVSAPDEAARATVIALGDAVRSTSGAVDVCLTPGTVIDPASVQEVIRRRDALVAAVGAARTLAGPPSGGAHA